MFFSNVTNRCERAGIPVRNAYNWKKTPHRADFEAMRNYLLKNLTLIEIATTPIEHSGNVSTFKQLEELQDEEQ